MILNKLNRNKFLQIQGVYLLVFMLLMAIALMPFILESKSLIWSVDGIGQHYPILVELRAILVERLRHPFEAMQMWDFNIGIGADVIQSYSYYGLGDFISYLIVLFPIDKLEVGYNLLTILRLYLVGASFLLYIKKYNYSTITNITGALFYVFSGYALTLYHPFFLNPLFLLPLMCYFIDRIFAGKAIWGFSLTVAYILINNFYFAYMLAIFGGWYFMIQYFVIYKKSIELGKVFMRILTGGIMGFLISAIIFLPSVYGFLTASRAESNLANGVLIYPVSYYLNLLKGLIGNPSTMKYDAKLGFASIFLFVLVYLFVNRKKYRALFISLCVSFVILLLPTAGAIMNGFSSPSQRWSFAIAFISGIATCHFMEHLETHSIKLMKNFVIALIVYLCLYWINPELHIFPTLMMGPVIFLLINFVVISYGFFADKVGLKKMNVAAILLVVLCLDVSVNTFTYFSSGFNGRGMVLTYFFKDEADAHFIDQFRQNEKLITDQDFYRSSFITQDYNYKFQNSNGAFIRKQNQLASYLSIQSKYPNDFSKSIGNFQRTNTNPIQQLDNRTIANNYLGARYILGTGSDQSVDMYGYQLKATKNNLPIYQTNNDFPLLFTSDNDISYESFEQMSELNREEFLSLGVVAESSTKKLTDDFDYLPMSKVKFITNSTSNNKFTLDNTEGNYILKMKNVEKMKNGELFLKITGMTYEPFNAYERLEDYLVTIKDETEASQNQLIYRHKLSNLWQSPDDTMNLLVNYEDTSKTIRNFSKLDVSAYDYQEDFLINLGYHESSGSDIVLTGYHGKYQFSGMELYFREFNDTYDSRVTGIKERSLENIKVAKNKVTGSVNTSEETYLVSSIPYSSGWTASINGKKVQTEKVNAGFIGLKLPVGENHLKLTYETPWLHIGKILSFFGIILLCITTALHYFKSKSVRKKINDPE